MTPAPAALAKNSNAAMDEICNICKKPRGNFHFHCSVCGATESNRWHIIDGKDMCHHCYQDQAVNNSPTVNILGGFDRKLQERLPKNHVLGPKMPGMDGMRGVFERTKKR